MWHTVRFPPLKIYRRSFYICRLQLKYILKVSRWTTSYYPWHFKSFWWSVERRSSPQHFFLEYPIQTTFLNIQLSYQQMNTGSCKWTFIFFSTQTESGYFRDQFLCELCSFWTLRTHFQQSPSLCTSMLPTLLVNFQLSKPLSNL